VVPLDNYTADTLDLLTASVAQFNGDAALVEGCNKLSARKGAQCALNLPAPQKVDLYPIQVAFDYIVNPEERNWFKNLPTTFELPRETIDRLRQGGTTSFRRSGSRLGEGVERLPAGAEAAAKASAAPAHAAVLVDGDGLDRLVGAAMELERRLDTREERVGPSRRSRWGLPDRVIRRLIDIHIENLEGAS
jgi:hypothetical protein